MATVVSNPESIEVVAREVHKVALPPEKTTFAKFKSKIKEIFFPDDPLRQFKGVQSPRTRFVLVAKYLFPILQWLPCYNLKLFKSDLVSGLTIASLAIPQVGNQEKPC